MLQPTVLIVDSKAKGNLTLHPLPKIDKLYAKLSDTKIFSVLDLTSGYYHIKLGNDSCAKTTFVTPFGNWEFNMVPFSLDQAPAYFQVLISMVLEGLSHFAIAYLDDIIIFGKNEEEHLQHLEVIFKRLREAGLKLKRSKCSFMKMHIEYLDHPISEKNIRSITVHHPVTYMSRLFRGSQLNWAALTKEVYVIDMSVKKLSFYLTDTEITVRSDHLPLKKFLLKNTLNSKVNNLAVELKTFNIHFEHILGIRNTLADTLSHLVKIDPDMRSEPEKEGYKFGYSCFEELPPAEVFNIEETIVKT